MEIPGYKILREIGRGGMAAVYLAEQESLGRPVALKVLFPSLLSDATSTQRFVREGRTVAQLRHTNIVSIFDIGVVGEHHYIAMEYLDGGNLKSRIESGLNPKSALDVMRQMALALGYAHEKGFVHRDVKPENILFRDDGTAVLTDFGISKALHTNTRLTETGTSMGTPHYMSPEQVRGQPIDQRADLYALGVILYEMLMGRPPFTGTDPIAVAFAQVNEPAPKLPRELYLLQPLMSRLLAKAPDDRYRNADELLEALAKFRKTRNDRGEPDLATKAQLFATEILDRARDLARRRPQWIYGSVGALSAVVLALVVVGFVERGGRPARDASGPTAPAIEPAVAAATPAPVGASPSPEPADPTAATNAAPALPSAAAPVPDPVDAQLARADAAFAAGRFTEPPGDNALENYRAVLREQPDNARARDGVSRVVAHYLEQAQRSLAGGQPEAALLTIEQGISAVPDDSTLLSLRTQIRRDQGFAPAPADEAAGAPDTIESLLAEADADVAANRLTVPADNSAHHLYLEVLKRDPDNAAAQMGLRRIADRYAQFARSSLGRAATDEASKYIATGLRVLPQHDELKKLQADIEARRTAVATAPDQAQLYAQAEQAYWRQDYVDAIPLYRRAASEGHSDAMFSLGVAAALGQGMNRNEQEAVAWFRKAAQRLHPEAEYHLGLAYAQGHGVRKDETAAVSWFLKAAEQDMPDAYKKLGWMYQHGLGVSQDWKQSVQWYSKASKKDFEAGINDLKQFFGGARGQDKAPEVKHVASWEFGDPVQ